MESSGGIYAAGASVTFVYTAIGHPIDIMTNLILTEGNYPVGLGLSHNFIDSASFQNVKNLLPDWEMSLLIYSIDDLLKFFEKEILQAINGRFVITNENKIGLVRLGIDRAVASGQITDQDIIKYKQTTVNYSDIVNIIKVQYDLSLIHI